MHCFFYNSFFLQNLIEFLGSTTSTIIKRTSTARSPAETKLPPTKDSKTTSETRVFTTGVTSAASLPPDNHGNNDKLVSSIAGSIVPLSIISKLNKDFVI